MFSPSSLSLSVYVSRHFCAEYAIEEFPISNLKTIINLVGFIEMGRTPWQVRSYDDRMEFRDVYDLYPPLVSFKIHHGGRFTNTPGRQYLGGKTHYVELVDTDTFSVHELQDMMHEIGYTTPRPTYYHFLVPGKDLDNGLHALGSDMDILEFLKFVPKYKVFEIYTEHWVSKLNTYNRSPGVSNVVIEQLPDEGQPELGTIKRVSKTSKKLLLEWNVGDSGVDVDAGKEALHTDELPTGVDFDAGKEPLVEDEFPIGVDNSMLDDFDPFWGEGENVDGEANGNNSDPDFEVELHNLVDEVAVDMDTFHTNTDLDVEWMEKNGMATEIPNVDGDADTVYMDGLESNTDDEDLEAERKSLLRKLRREKVAVEEDTVSFDVGKVFGSKKEIKRLIDLHAIQSRRQIHLIRNDTHRVRAVCRGSLPEMNKEYGVGSSTHVGTKASDGKSCPWLLHISKGKNDSTWMVKTFVESHKCLQSMKVKACTASFLSKEIVDLITHNPEIPIKALQVEMQRTYGQKMSHMKAFRAKTMALNVIRGNYAEQYNHLGDYALELQRTNPRTTVKLDVECAADPSGDSRRFKRIYICFESLKKGFKAGKRDFLGLDGAFMKGPYPGQILTAVGIDSNNGTYPLAWAIVEAETTNSWTWFLQLLGDDLDITVRSNFTFISDRQKGIIPAIAKVFPSAEHRFCVRHIQENMKLSWRGKEITDQLWKCAAAPTVPEFQEAMNGIKAMSTQCYDWLKQIPLHHWSRAHFTGRSHTDCILNNFCEVFNKQLVEARDKPIVSCLEYIREYVMKRIGNVNKCIEKADGPLTPKAALVLEEIKKEAINYRAIWNGGSKYQVNGPWLDNVVVDMSEKVCSCRRWELIGIPCKHAVATIWTINSNGAEVGMPEFWVDEVYWLDTWKKMYSFHLEPINGPKMWPKSTCPTKLLPPTHHKQVGRPKKKRVKSVTEITDGKRLKRVGKTVRCVKCGKEGHNKRTCKGQAPT
ncbi:hypothetical protein OSB04_004329 [Centaurea solstitialis]|uniref:SWIM-type domain-containing protein n=1 Tax=Centaurea solstitialis TaxID=347529 RepID=A0AA38TWL5_9ASTR|nr:hypothetical protein OSB04_004329 [Centaurea solstitialis]